MSRAVGHGRYRARIAACAADVRAAQRLRHLAFVSHGGAPPRPGGLDRDHFDTRCRHVLIEMTGTGALVCCFRLLPLAGGAQIERSYCAKYYDLSRLRNFPAPMLEVGRFCLHPDHHDPDIMRTAWAAITRCVDQARVEMLFGCSSFRGTDVDPYRDVFAALRARHLAPGKWRPGVRSPEVFRFSELSKGGHDARAATAAMPPLLRSYLAMGGWVSDHAVLDRALNTLHVFTGLEVRAIPPARARRLRALAG